MIYLHYPKTNNQAYSLTRQNCRVSALSWMPAPLTVSVFCICAVLSHPLQAQNADQVRTVSGSAAIASGNLAGEDQALNESAGKLRNGFAEKLQAKIKRPNHLQNQPYQPISKQDDQGQIPEIEMFVGESRVFPTPGVARLAVGNGQIMSAAALDNKEVIIFANGVGTSSLFVWNEDGRYQRIKVNIVPGDTSRIAREVAAFLSGMPNAKASIVGDKVIVEGDNLSDADLSKIEKLEKRYPQIVNFTNQVGWEQMVMMDVKVVEFPKAELREIGLKWSAAGGATLGSIWRPIRYGNERGLAAKIPASGAGLPIVSANSADTAIPLPSALNILGALDMGITAQLNLLEQDGRATVLAEPQLSARSGSKASFLAGGEFPYSVSNLNGVTIQFKPYGIKLDIVPKVDRNGVIRATIESEVSSLDPSVSAASGPALLIRRTNTEFNVRNGETMVLSGLLQRNTSNDIDKVPLLGDIPILGALFRSKRFQNKETELVVFVTPTVVDSRSPGLLDRVERATERLQENLGKSPYLSHPLQPEHDPARTNQRPADRSIPKPAASVPAGANSNSAEPLAAGAQQTPSASVQSVAGIAPASISENPWQVEKNAVKGGSTLRVGVDGLVLRAEPDVKSQALLQLGRGSVVLLGSANPQPSGIGYWRNVVVGELDGWVLADAVAPTHLQPTLKPYASSALGRTDQANSAQRLDANTPQTLTADGATKQTANSAAALRNYRVMLNKLALRVAPDMNAAVVQSLAEGQMVQALAVAPRNYWMAVQIGGQRGWVASQWLSPVTSSN